MVLDGENFSGTNFEGACFTNASIDILILEHAHSLWKAKMPNGSYYDGRLNLIGDLEMAKKMGYDLSDVNQYNQFYELK